MPCEEPSEDLPCLPFRQLPNATRLFSDYSDDFSLVKDFYGAAPKLAEIVKGEPAKIPDERRRAVAAVLRRQNQSFLNNAGGASAETIANIARFESGASVAVAGQQVALFGGPLFSLYKALTAVHMAREATKAGRECVPVYWLASEDHDLAEVSRVHLMDAEGAPRAFELKLPGHIEGAPVGALKLGPEITALVDEAARLLGEGDVTDALRESYRAGETLSSAYARLFTRLLGRFGIILLDASDAELHRLAAPLYRHAAERARELDEALLERGRALEAAGYHQQVKVTASSCLLFAIRGGARRPMKLVNGDFQVEREKIPRADMISRIEASPTGFSPNVLLRPVVQDYLLPTLAIAGGPAEVAYFAQASVVYNLLLGRTTPILPRFSATLVEPAIGRILARHQLELPDLFHGEGKLEAQLGAQALPAAVGSQFEEASRRLEESLAAINRSLATLDPTLEPAAQRAAGKMRYQLGRLRSRAARAELRRGAETMHHARRLLHALFPNGNLQEREIAGVSFLARHGPALADRLLQAADGGCSGHQVIAL